MKTMERAIEEISLAYPDLFLEHCAAMAVSLMKPIGAPCEFMVRIHGFEIPREIDSSEFVLRVTWSSITESVANRLARTEQRRPTIERAAVAMAMLLFASFIPLCEITVASVGDRYDYCLPGLNCGLEISGTERRAELERRSREKRLQLLDNPRNWGGYVVVCCFDKFQPMIQWDYWSNSGDENASHQK